jgi:hypothetical protein
MFKIELVSNSTNNEMFEFVWTAIQDALKDHRFDHEVTADVTVTGTFSPASGTLKTTTDYI